MDQKLPQQAGSSLSDLMSTLKNLVQAVNGVAQNYLNVQGLTNSANITVPTVVKSTPGRACRVSILVAGSAVGTIYDGASGNATTKPISIIPMTVGVFDVGMPLNFGLLVVPGTGQTVSVSYS